METNKNIHRLLADNMAWENADINAPDVSRMMHARNVVAARKKTAPVQKNVIAGIISFLNFDLKFYHLGISVLLLMVGTFYITESHYGVSGNAGFNDHTYNSLSIKSSTISVNSATMLTSIPTLRN